MDTQYTQYDSLKRFIYQILYFFYREMNNQMGGKKKVAKECGSSGIGGPQKAASGDSDGDDESILTGIKRFRFIFIFAARRQQ